MDINGNIDDERCALDLEQKLDNPHYKELDKNEKPLLGSCNLIYLFEGETGVIKAIEAEFETHFSMPKKILVKLSLLKKLVDKNAFLIEEEKETKTGFWSKIFKS